MAEVISVRFRSGAKNYYFDPKGLTVQPDEYVVVETAQGIEYAKCTEGNHDVPDESVIQPLRGVVRIATENDHKAVAYNRKREKEAVGICEQKIAAHGLEMKLVNVECSFEGNKIIFSLPPTGGWISGNWSGIWRGFFAPASSCGRSACGTRRKCWAASASVAGPCAVINFWRNLSRYPSKWPRRRTSA